MATARKAIVIHSPSSGRSAQLNEALSYLQQTGIELADIIAIAALDGLPAQGPVWQERGIDVVIAAGGDGLIGGVITHIIESDLVLGILPLGTANDIARSIKIPLSLRLASEVIAADHTSKVDVGKAQPAEQMPHESSSSHTHAAAQHIVQQHHGFFAHTLTVGVNVEFARLATNIAIRQRYKSFTYPFAAIEALRNHTFFDMKMEFTGLAAALAAPEAAPSTIQTLTTLHCRALQVTVINAPIFGGALQLSIPGARIDDRLLDIVVVENIDLEKLSAPFLRFFNHAEHPPVTSTTWHEQYPEFRLAELTGIPGIHHVRAQGISIATSIDPQDVTLDGEVRGQTPISAQMADEQLRVLTPGG
ncbi:MAG TPA: diacylglycerol kinase family protein [Ktedonosporobacter sp.]|nr:diacylglycerol kinase family protein [Ktedonosporobacter sp.]